MARRASSSLPIGTLIGGIGGVAALLLGGYVFLGGTKDAFRTTTPFPVKEYLESPNSLRGNTYKLEATVDKTLEVSQGAGRLFSVESGGEMLPVLVPASLNGTNVERGQKLQFKVQVAENGLIRVEELRKP
jgi:hypothetical protein